MGDVTENSDVIKYYASSPFDDVIIDKTAKVTAITVIGVYALIFMTGVIGHFCVITYFAGGRRCRPSNFSAHLILTNLSFTQLLYLLLCLPPSAYVAVMEMASREWFAGDVACKMLPFLQTALLGVTSLSLCAIAIDRFRASGHVTKSYEIRRESWTSGICKIILVWIISGLLAAPELLLREVVVTSVLAVESNRLSVFNAEPMIVTSQEYVEMRRKEEFNFPDLTKAGLLREEKAIPAKISTSLFPNQQNLSLVVRYDVCVDGMTSWKTKFPPFIGTFMDYYVTIRNWWCLAFYFCVPVFLSLILAIVISRRLTSSAHDVTSPALTAYCTTEGDTLTSQRGPDDRTPVLEGPSYQSGSLLSNKTHTSESYQHRNAAMDRPHGSSRQQPRLSPLYSSEDLTEPDRSPLVIHSNGSIRTINSHSRVPGCEMTPQSPLSPLSLACASGVSVLSLAMSNTCGGTLGNSSLPPHGHRRSIKRRTSKAVKTTLANISRERSFNSLIVTLVLCYMITQLPQLIVAILRTETDVLKILEPYYVSLLKDLSQYFFTLTFSVNPVVLFFSYKAYRRFLCRKCCHCA